ncbi:MAG TPA: AAA family ATPase [Noviherbaspirillum sp.]|uniref:ExeA family protein n=1 Tax=Noviherbaspirillum sp. TaxID=1926288 RepID=UPI002B473312|nr:AAA family ATPase [Noviherbaspirillum sp.]HJV86181.1 AAA family ATPase [Noviherbaspirillum sp.]
MYTQFFRLKQTPFSISPDPRYLFMSERHREALAHLLYGVDAGGGVVLLTGDIGTGKTTICRCFLEQAPASCNLAYIFNPKLNVIELLQAVCEEFHIDAKPGMGVKDYVDALNRFLLAAHAERRNNVLIIDEAQNLSADVLEQLRLLTNLETNERKLLQIILIGQPELRAMLHKPELEQLAQRVIAHYHLSALSEEETASYIQHRLATAGLTGASPFQQPQMKLIHRLTGGVPRRINLLCDRAMLGAFANGAHEVDHATIECAASELFINQHNRMHGRRSQWKIAALGMLAAALAGAAVWSLGDLSRLPAIYAAWSSPSSVERVKLVAHDGHNVHEVPASAPASAAEEKPREAPAAQASAPVTEAVKDKEVEAIISAQDGNMAGAFAGEAEAVRELASLWNVALAGNDPCDSSANPLVRCHRSSGGFAELRKLDRPAVLKLYDAGNKPRYAVLTALGDTAASLRAEGTMQSVRLVDLTRFFRGEFVTLWRVPDGPAGAAVSGGWIAAQLAKINGLDAAADPLSGQELQKQVRLFQRAHGLFVDGVAGPVTVMFINRLVGVAEPRLHEVHASGE